MWRSAMGFVVPFDICDRARKTDHFVIISDFEIFVPHCSAHFALHNCTVRFAIVYTVSKLRESKCEHPRNLF